MGRAPCCEKEGLKKGPWTPEEDKKLVDYIQNYGKGNWRTLPKMQVYLGVERVAGFVGLIIYGQTSEGVDSPLKRKRPSFNYTASWATSGLQLLDICQEGQIMRSRNYWNTHIRKRLLRMGIDPVTHSLRLDLLDFSSIVSIISSSLNHGIDPLSNPEILMLARNLLALQRQNMTNSCNNQCPMPHQANYSLGPQIQNRCNDFNAQDTTIIHNSNIANTQNLDLIELIQAGTGHQVVSSTTFDISTNTQEGLSPSVDHNLFYSSSAHMDVDIFSSSFYSNDDQICNLPATFSTQNPGSYVPRDAKSSNEDETESFSNKLLRFASLELLGF